MHMTTGKYVIASTVLILIVFLMIHYQSNGVKNIQTLTYQENRNIHLEIARELQKERNDLSRQLNDARKIIGQYQCQVIKYLYFSICLQVVVEYDLQKEAFKIVFKKGSFEKKAVASFLNGILFVLHVTSPFLMLLYQFYWWIVERINICICTWLKHQTYFQL